MLLVDKQRLLYNAVTVSKRCVNIYSMNDSKLFQYRHVKIISGFGGSVRDTGEEGGGHLPEDGREQRRPGDEAGVREVLHQRQQPCSAPQPQVRTKDCELMRESLRPLLSCSP